MRQSLFGGRKRTFGSFYWTFSPETLDLAPDFHTVFIFTFFLFIYMILAVSVDKLD